MTKANEVSMQGAPKSKTIAETNSLPLITDENMKSHKTSKRPAPAATQPKKRVRYKKEEDKQTADEGADEIEAEIVSAGAMATIPNAKIRTVPTKRLNPEEETGYEILKSLLDEMKKIKTMEERYALCLEVAENNKTLVEHENGLYAWILDFVKWNLEDKERMENDKVVWEYLDTRSKQHYDIERIIRARWNAIEMVASGLSQHRVRSSYANKVELLSKFPWSKSKDLLNHSAWARIKDKHQKQTRTKLVISSDVEEAYETLKGNAMKIEIPTEEQMHRYHLKFDKLGLIYEKDGVEMAGSDEPLLSWPDKDLAAPKSTTPADHDSLKKVVRRVEERKSSRTIMETKKTIKNVCTCKDGLEESTLEILHLPIREITTELISTFLNKAKTADLKICTRHAYIIMKAMRLRTDMPPEALLERLAKCIERQSDWQTLKYEEGTWIWFQGAKPPVLKGEGDYQGFKIPANCDLLFNADCITWDRILTLLGGLNGEATGPRDFWQNGYYHTAEKFPYWFEKGPGPISLAEMSRKEAMVYDYHAGMDRGKMTGTLGNMQHAICQQVLRMDLTSYLLSLGLRGDGKYALYAYPEPIKYVTSTMKMDYAEVQGHPREYYHQDSGATNHSAFRGWLTIATDPQRVWKVGSGVANGRETINTWWEKGNNGQLLSDGSSHCFKPSDLESTCGLKLAVDFKRVGHVVGGFQAILPLNPEVHKENLVDALDIPVCYVAANKGGKDLEVTKAGTVVKLKDNLSNLTSPRTYIHGAPMDPIINPAWAPTIKLRPVTCISAAIMGMVGWNDPGVLSELNYVFNGPEKAVRRMLDQAQKSLRTEAWIAWQRFEIAERKMYGQYSAFKNIEEGVSKKDLHEKIAKDNGQDPGRLSGSD